MYNLEENLQGHKARFLDIMECADKSLRNMRLEALETDMESCYGIPKVGEMEINAFAKGISDVYQFYLTVKNARWS